MSSKTPPETVITLRLPSTRSGIQRRGQGTLLIQRGDLAHIQQFSYTDWDSVQAVIRQAEMTLTGLEIDPPETPSPAVTSVENPPEAASLVSTTEVVTEPASTGETQDNDAAQPVVTDTSEPPASDSPTANGADPSTQQLTMF